MTIALVAAMDAAGLIGVGGGLPWHLPADLARFRALTLRQVVVVGRRTYESIPNRLPQRTVFVLSRDDAFDPEQTETFVFSDLGRAFAQAADWQRDVFIIGGADVFAQALPLADVLHLTRIRHTFPAGEGAVYFPRWDEAAWRLAASEARAADAANPHAMVFERWERR